MLARTVLRFCVLEALRPTAEVIKTPPVDPDEPSPNWPPIWPTLARHLVFDSRLDPIDDLAAAMRQPVIVVYTEHNRLDRLSQHGTQFRSKVDLTFEISVIATERQGDQYVAGLAFSDAEIEADLDLLEEQIFCALSFSPSGRLFRKLAKLPLDDWQSTPHRSPEEGFRLATRTIKAPVELQPICYGASHAAAPTGLDRLPQPLRGIVEQLAETSYGAQIATGLLPHAPTMPPLPPLSGVTIAIDSKSPPAPAGEAAPHIVAGAEGLQEG